MCDDMENEEMQELLRCRDGHCDENEDESVERDLYALQKQQTDTPPPNESNLRQASSSEPDVMNQLRRAIRADADAAVQIEATRGVRNAELQRKLFAELDDTARVARFPVRESVAVENAIRRSLHESGIGAPRLRDMMARARQNAHPVDAWQYT
jgi:hypothetical protein